MVTLLVGHTTTSCRMSTAPPSGEQFPSTLKKYSIVMSIIRVSFFVVENNAVVTILLRKMEGGSCSFSFLVIIIDFLKQKL